MLALVAGLALAAGLALTAGAAPSRSAGQAGPSPVSSRSRGLLHDGDSLAVGTQLYLRRALPGWRIRASVDVSRHAPEGPAVMRRLGSRLPRVIVVSLGTNDDPRALGTFRRAIRTTMRVAGRRRCVVWANVVRPPVGGAGYGGLNRVLAREARRRRNLRISSGPGWRAPTAAGSAPTACTRPESDTVRVRAASLGWYGAATDLSACCLR